MSVSPSGISNGQTPTPTSGPPQFVRKPKAADPLRPRKKPVRRPNLPPNSSALKPNGPVPASKVIQKSLNGLPVAQLGTHPGMQPPRDDEVDPKTNGGWSTKPAGSFNDYPLVTTKRALREGLRYHIARFAAKKDVDPADQNEFTRPIALHRRDPRQPPPGKSMQDDDTATDDVLDSKDREKQEILKAEKEARRAADLAQIAPTGNNAAAIAAKKSQAFRNEKTTQVYRLDKTAEQKKESDLRYEEALPWHLEDADNKNIWVGNYEAALSDTNVMFAIDGNCFKMIPVEKWYKFISKSSFKPLTIEEAEAAMSKKHKETRWALRDKEKGELEQQNQFARKAMGSLYTVKSESNSFKNSGRREIQDMDDLDFTEQDLFQDDDEQPTVEPDNDEDTKEAQERIKRDRLGANVFDKANEAEIDAEFALEEKEAEVTKKLGKEVLKSIISRERNLMYKSDRSDNPYSSESDDYTSDEEKQAEIDKRKDEEAKAKAKAKAELKLPSGTSTKGTNTPSGRPKHVDSLKASKSLKRPGSPNLSESSGNESSRKKHKKKHHTSRPPGSSTPIPGSRPMSPAPSVPQPAPGQSPRKSSIIKLNLSSSKLSDIQSTPPNPSPTNGGAMSDGEGTGGEMSDGAGGKKKKIKLRLGGQSPTGSRSGTPVQGRIGSIATGSRAGSPASQEPIPTGPQAQSPSTGPIQPHEIVAALPPTGITIHELMRMFTARVGNIPGQQTPKQEFILLVKENSSYGTDKLLRKK
ncbi:hypothetical protein B7494_g7237 [Chlorociboria aeruginascens]|nr:hypothetical protein B7494_g7237 [Chlorociboria aeruginascens]